MLIYLNLQLECKLWVLDTEITTEERIDAWKKGGGAEAEYEMLRFKGTCTTSA